MTSILWREFVWGLAEDTKISLHFFCPPSTDSDTRHYSCLNITSPFFPLHLAPLLPFPSLCELADFEQDEFRRDKCSTVDVHIWGTVVCPAFSYKQPHTCGVTNLAANHDLITPKRMFSTRQYQRVTISAFNAVYIRSHTNANLIKGQTEPLKVLCSLLH